MYISVTIRIVNLYIIHFAVYIIAIRMMTTTTRSNYYANRKTVAITNKLHDELSAIGKHGESFEQIIERCLNAYKKVNKLQ
jgi:hypothetical protein